MRALVVVLLFAALAPAVASPAAACLVRAPGACHGDTLVVAGCGGDTVDAGVGDQGADDCDGVDLTILGRESDGRDLVDVTILAEEENDTSDTVDVALLSRERGDRGDTVDVLIGGSEDDDVSDEINVEALSQVECLARFDSGATHFCLQEPRRE